MPHCNREEFVLVAKPDCRFSDTLAVYLLPRLVLTRTLRLLENRLTGKTGKTGKTVNKWRGSGPWAGAGRAIGPGRRD